MADIEFMYNIILGRFELRIPTNNIVCGIFVLNVLLSTSLLGTYNNYCKFIKCIKLGFKTIDIIV